MAPKELTWLELTDFSPGIFSNNNLAGGINVTSDNPCKAQETGTYRCRSLPTGGLGPLPRLKGSYGLTTIPDSTAGVTYNVTGFGTWGRILDVPNTSTLGFEAHVMLYYQLPDAGLFDVSLTWVRERLFNVIPSTEIIHNVDIANTSTSAGRYTYFLKTRMNPTTPDSIGAPVMVCVSTRIANNDIIVSRAWPDPAAPTTNGTIIVGEALEGTPYVIAAAHQGRIVLGAWDNFSHGLTADLVTNENMYWTETNDNTLVSANPAQFVPELDQSISDMCAMSANQLVVVKWYGGGYVLQGDLSDTTVVQLPNLPCPDGSDYVRGVNTAKGFVYSGGPSGMYLWNGGDGAEPISPQLDGNFAVGANFISGSNGQCDRWMDLVLVPQNWVWDSNTGGWWRIENINTVNMRYWSTVAQNAQAVGVESSFTTVDPTFMHLFQYDDLAYSWSWKSHPLWVMPYTHYMEIREVTVALSGTGKFTFTFTAEDGDTSVHAITVNSTSIRNFRFNLGLDAENFTLQIEAVGGVAGVGGAEAPLLHRMFVGYHQDSHLVLTDAVTTP